ncbi:MAG: S26 family signal peptidase [Methanospirillum sp.]|nr:S26 family signal peptidase [Methanospirillum sp.]
MGASRPDPSVTERLRDPGDRWGSLARDLAWVVGVVGLIALVLFLVSGTWPAVVTIESESMVPNMNVGDLVLVVAADRYGALVTSNEGSLSRYGRFNDLPDRAGEPVWGDVIVYRPNGATDVHPIIHRAIGRVNESEAAEQFGADHGGYITKGDNNPIRDQDGGYAGLGRLQPVKPEWIVGKALFAVPIVGYLPLHLFEVAAIVIGAMLLWELWQRRRDRERAPEPPRERGSKKKPARRR